MYEEKVWPPSLPDFNTFRYFVCGESKVWVIAKSRNKTKDLIHKKNGSDGVLQEGHRGEGLQELEAQDLRCC